MKLLEKLLIFFNKRNTTEPLIETGRSEMSDTSILSVVESQKDNLTDKEPSSRIKALNKINM